MENSNSQKYNERLIDTSKLKEALHAYEAEKAALFAKFGIAPHAPPVVT